MATFTMSLADAIETTGGTVEVEHMTFKGVDMGHIGKLAGGEIGIGFMPIFDEEYRSILTGKIVEHFWNREIGHETIDMFRMRMRVKLNEIMPFYNQLYKSTEIPYEALSTINLKTESANSTSGTESTSGVATGEGENKSGTRAVQSTTPQTMLAGNEDYASSAADTNTTNNNTSRNESEANSESAAESNSDSLVSGYQGTPADLIMRFRDSLINIDLMVIRDLDELFMQVFDNADSYTQRGFGYYGYY